MKPGGGKKFSTMIPLESELFPLVLKYLYRYGQVRVADLVAEPGIPVQSLEPALKALVENGFIRWESQAGISGADSRITLRDDDVHFIGVDLGGTKLYAGVANLAGKVLFDIERRHNGKSGEACYQILEEVLDLLIDKAASNGIHIRGMGIQVPGRVQPDSGMVVNAAAIKWDNFPLKERLKSKYGYPVFVDNDLKQSALGEAWFGAGKINSNVALVAIGTGLAASVVVEDVLQRGAHGRHGEVGWMVPGREFLGRRYKGFGALEDEASGSGIARRARALLTGNRSADELAALTSEEVFKAAREGEKWAKQVVAETVEYLAILIANIMAFYDPDIIILSGGVSRSHDLLIQPILDLVEGCLLIQPNIVVSNLGYQAGVLGAVVNLLLNCPEIYQSEP